jgi:FKBP-type peptidyl-prolyl cis-trans isomerase 2
MAVKQGDSVKVHYIGTLNDGNEFDNSYKRGGTLDFTAGGGQMIKGFDDAVMGMEVGDKKTVNIPCVDAYGEHDPKGLIPVSKENFPPDFNAQPGEMIQGQSESGQPMNALVVEVQDENVILDLNHPLAGQDLNFEIELMEVEG